MFQLLAFRRSLRVVALALCSASIVVSVTPAHARSHHGAGRHARGYHAGHHARHYVHIRHRHIAEASRWERGVAQMQAGGFADTHASFSPNASAAASASAAANSTLTPTGGAMASSFGSSGIVAEARRYVGGNPTGRGSLWCARFMNMVLQHSGYRGTGSDMASSFAHYGQRISGPQVGAIAVMSRGRGGGHVGIITGIDAAGNPIMISGNNGNRVREAPISRGRIYAYVMPAG
jgi:uncharacterized protein (TIGR02594 family)